MSKRVLIDFRHGLGDVVQSTVVLKHLQKYRPDWQIHYRCGIGKESAVKGLCSEVSHDKQPGPEGHFDTKLVPPWWENYCRYTYCPNSKITNCLAEQFGLSWDATLARYEINVGPEALARCEQYLASIGAEKLGDRYKVVVCHYEGNTSSHKKNLSQWQMKTILEPALAAGYLVVVLDWDRRCRILNGKTIVTPPCGPGDIWGGFGTGDAETIAALISLASCYLGIDSGPGKVCSATETPSLIHWTGHHPIQFHDPAPNTVHLVPREHRKMPPMADQSKEVVQQIGDFFEANYLHRFYDGSDFGLVIESRKWLAETLSIENPPIPVKCVVPTGIGDSVWALHKIRAIFEKEHPGVPIKIILCGDPGNTIDHRSLSFLRRFDFIESVEVMDVPVLQSKSNPTDEQGRYKYVTDGMHGPYHFLTPNHALERGVRLEDWLPEYPCDWDVMKRFSLEGTEKGKAAGAALGKFVAFYLGPERGNVDEGHNRGFLWEPKHWNALGKWFTKQGCRVVVVGAPYDRSYWEKYVREGVGQEGMEWVDMIGSFDDIGDPFAFLLQAKCFISYQCGLGIVSHYLGQKVAMWWRPDGDSCHPERKVCFDERMAHCWTNPALRENYLPLIYKRETVADVIRMVDDRGWVK
ncbi:MAG: hypothetical protein K2X38_04325 [Gemmataceae bacterium]|nr:hypothetical protein [Gemmataceae bacterium]